MTFGARMTIGALLIPVSLATYIGGMVLLANLIGPDASPAWLVPAFAWALLTLAGGLNLSAWLMTSEPKRRS